LGGGQVFLDVHRLEHQRGLAQLARRPFGFAQGRCVAENVAVKNEPLKHAGAGDRLAQKQAISRSRGGRNTKIHALADARGRLLSALLTGGQAHDCPPARRLIRRTKPAAKLLGDTAYDSAELRRWLNDRGTTPVVPNRPTASSRSASTSEPTINGIASRMPSAASRTSGASSHATTGSLEISSPRSALPPRSYGGFNESRP